MPKIEAGTIPLVEAGTTTATTATKLVDSSQNFLSTVSVGDLIRNTTDSTFALVTAIDSDTILSVDTDIFTISEDYTIENKSPAQSFLIDGKPYQRGAYELDFRANGTDIGIRRLGAPILGQSYLIAPVDFSDYTDSADAAFVSVAAFIADVEPFFFIAN